MRWRVPRPGDFKIKTRFLIFPCASPSGEVRWLELAKLIYKYVARDNDGTDPYCWRFVGFQEEIVTNKLEGRAP
jgi:hypothetical protein